MRYFGALKTEIVNIFLSCKNFFRKNSSAKKKKKKSPDTYWFRPKNSVLHENEITMKKKKTYQLLGYCASPMRHVSSQLISTTTHELDAINSNLQVSKGKLGGATGHMARKCLSLDLNLSCLIAKLWWHRHFLALTSSSIISTLKMLWTNF